MRTSPMNSDPPGASRSMAVPMTSPDIPHCGKYWTTELRMTVSKWPRGSDPVTCGGLGEQFHPITPRDLQLFE